MNDKIEFYTNIYKISKEIELLIQLENFEQIDVLLKNRQELLDKIEQEDFKIQEIAKIIEQIKALDEINFEKMNNSKQKISEKLINLSRKRRIIGSYKQEEIHNLRIVDEINS